MRQKAVIAGVGITPFGKLLDRTLASLGQDAIRQALSDAGIGLDRIQAVWSGNAGGPVVTGQVCVAGQVVLRQMGFGGVPVINVENACATASTAFQQACSMVSLGAYDVVLAFGMEKLYHPDKERPMAVYAGCVDTERPELLDQYLVGDLSAAQVEAAPQDRRSLFMDIYARMARDYMAASGATQRDFALVSAKNSRHGSLNPNAQFRDVLSVEDVLSAKLISPPLTLPMCSPIGDGAAAAVIVSPRVAAELGISDPVHVLSSIVSSGFDVVSGAPGVTVTVSRQAYEEAGIDPRDIDCVELHDATSPAELIYYEALGLCGIGEGPSFLASGATTLGGHVPVNPSGGLVRKGHPIGATGLGQIHELVQQLRGRCGARQAVGAKLAFAENGGGFIGTDAAAIAMTVLSR
ncbi:thiolase family protein [Sphingopyxis sp. FD7]|uniref:thiolase family protein n=1 Tax=Sphingopyxis sp. FD7 TaxID=1914525 RepID=UPI000DC63022|nr:thiolase family protein [Sphingopyxis sp. FD7]BBB14011.1 acetyl-CoA C-acyltransferase [Sphingopyxis sp. FD7]